MKSLTAVTLVRSAPQRYQVTFWADGTARWDGTLGIRPGAWQGVVDPDLFARLAEQAGEVRSSRSAPDHDMSVILDGASKTKVCSAVERKAPSLLWHVATLVDGMAVRTRWVPLNSAGTEDFAAWGSGTRVSLVQRGCQAEGLALPEGILVLAGSQLSTTTSPSLQSAYVEARERLQDEGLVTLVGERFVLTEHQLYTAPSAAASVVTGANTNGWQSWRDQLGQPLAEAVSGLECK